MVQENSERSKTVCGTLVHCLLGVGKNILFNQFTYDRSNLKMAREKLF